MFEDLIRFLFATDDKLAGGSPDPDEDADEQDDEVDDEEDPTAGEDESAEEEETDESDEEAPRTFTQRELDTIVRDRLKQERKKYKTLEGLLSKISSAKDPQAAIEELGSELSKYKREATQLKVGGELGLPTKVSLLLQGETEEEMRDHAQDLLEVWGKPKKSSRQEAPPTDAVAGKSSRVKGGTGDSLTAVQRQAAQKMGLTPKQYADRLSKMKKGS